MATDRHTSRSNRQQRAHRRAPIRLLLSALLLALAAGLGLRTWLVSDALAPAVASLMFVLAAGTAGAAVLVRRATRSPHWLDLAGVVTFVGVAIAAMIEPEQMMRLMESPAPRN